MNFIGYNSNQQNNGGCPSGSNGMSSNRGGNPGMYSMSTTRMNTGGNRAIGGGSGYGPYSTMSSPNTFVGQQQVYGYQPQQPVSSSRQRQQVGRCCRPQMQLQQIPQQRQMMTRTRVPVQPRVGIPRPCPVNCPAAPNVYAPRPDAAVMVNVSAATLANAKNTPMNPDRSEGSVDGNSNVKYIPLNWADILGKTGFNGMKVSMAPSEGSGNRQLKVSFGGGPNRVDPQSGETPLKVVSIQPVNAGAMNQYAGQGNASQQNNAMNFTVGSQIAPQNRCNCANCQGGNR